jgi:hypothetical protein
MIKVTSADIIIDVELDKFSLSCKYEYIPKYENNDPITHKRVKAATKFIRLKFQIQFKASPIP